MSFTLRAKRVLIGATAGAMALSMLPAGVASADIDDVCANAPDAEFDDAGTTHADNINCLVAYEIGLGLAGGENFGTFSPLTRGQAATLFVNFALVATDGAIADDVDEDEDVPFTDIDGTTHESNIEILYRLGLISGTTETTYSPNANISRAQFATILFNAHEALGVEFDEEYAQAFIDTATSVHNDEINALAGEGIISGTTATTYSPSENVQRGQTATLLMESAGVLDELGLWDASLPGQTNQTFTVTPDSLLQTEADEDRAYSVSGVNDDEDYRIVLFDPDNVIFDDGVVSFEEDGSTGEADEGTVDANITIVNGSDVGDAAAQEASPVNGSLSFTVESDGGTDDIDAAVPVVFLVGGDDDDNLEIDGDGLPEEDFGVGGETQWIPAEADAGDPAADEEITFADTENNVFASASGSFFYDADDTFQIATAATDGAGNEASTCVQVTMAEFEENLSEEDEIDQSSTYQPGDFASTLCLEDLAPMAPANLDAVVDSDTQIDLDWDASATDSVDEYNVYAHEDACVDTDDDDLSLIGTTDEIEFEATGLATDTDHCFVVTAVDGADESAVEVGNGADDGDNTIDATTDATAAAQTPSSTGLSFIEDGDTDGLLGEDDTIVVTFDRTIEVAAGDTVRVHDISDGDEGTLTNGSNSTFSITGDDDEILRVEVTGDPSINTVRGDAIIDSGNLAIVSSTVGNDVGDWNLAESGLPTLDDFERVTGDENPDNTADLATVLGAAEVNANANDDEVVVDDTTLDEDDEVIVYDFNGVEVGRATADGDATGVTVETDGFDADDTLHIVYRDADTFNELSVTLAYEVAPFIAGAVFDDAEADGLFGDDAADELVATFSSPVDAAAAVEGDGAVSLAELEDILGLAPAGDGTNATFTATVDGSAVTFTVESIGDATPDTDGFDMSQPLPGEANVLILDLDGDGQVVAVSPVTP